MSNEIAAHNSLKNAQEITEGISGVREDIKNIITVFHDSITGLTSAVELIKETNKEKADNEQPLLEKIAGSQEKLLVENENNEKSNLLKNVLETKDATKDKKGGILAKMGGLLSKMVLGGLKQDKLIGKNLKDIIKNTTAIAKKSDKKETPSITSQSANPAKIQTKPPQLDSKAIAGAMAGAATKALNVVTMVKTFITTILPKIIIFGLLLMMFIQSWFEVDLLDAFWITLGIIATIIIVAYLAYIAYQYIKAQILLAIQIACEFIKVAMAAGPYALMIVMIGIVAIAFLALCPLILLAIAGAFLMIAIGVGLLVKFLGETIVNLVGGIADAIVSIFTGIAGAITGVLGSIFGGLFGGKKEKDTSVNTQDAADMVEHVGELCGMLVEKLTGIADNFMSVVSGLLSTAVEAYKSFISELLLAVMNPFAWIKNLIGETQNNTFTEAIKPLTETAESIKGILKGYTEAVVGTRGIGTTSSNMSSNVTNVNNSDFNRITSINENENTNYLSSVPVSEGTENEGMLGDINSIRKAAEAIVEILDKMPKSRLFNGDMGV